MAIEREVREPQTMVEEDHTESILTQEKHAAWISSLEEVEDIIGYTFTNKDLLQQAYTDPSYTENMESSYERLEYLGDSILGLFIAREHVRLYPKLGPGELTRLRAANVDREKLARVAVDHNLHKYLSHNKPLLEGQIRDFRKAILEYPIHSKGLIDAPKALSDIVESTIGAIFLDTNSSIETTWKVVEKLLKPFITPETIQPQPSAYLHELCQKLSLKLIFQDMWSKTGEIEVYINNDLIGRGEYRSKRIIAYNRAAKNASDEIVRRFSSLQSQI